MIRKLVGLIKEKDSITYMHSLNVARYVNSYCKYYNVSDAITKNLVDGALLHDIGKIFIDDSILNKKTSLTDLEFKKVHQHTLLGYRFLKKEGVSQKKYIYSLYHHHRVDGQNNNYDFSANVDHEDIYNIEIYRRGIKLISICDSFDAMTSQRTYNRPKAFELALKEIRNCENTQFDAEIANRFLQLYSKTILKTYSIV